MAAGGAYVAAGEVVLWPRMNTDEHECLISNIIGASYEVSNTLGCGFLEKVYERALVRELIVRGVPVESQVRYPIYYKDHCVGDYVADLVVNNDILVELKCADAFSNEHMAQCINY